jgi:hypothetical protein
LFTSQFKGVSTVEARDYEQVVERGAFEFFISVPIKMP